ncbi:MAG: riboflavin synthase [Thermodesulfovibrionales bacterium]|nr:riboflavin synthase [Thermodesulfovibrionales bacterium]
MFTGIIIELGTVQSLIKGGKVSRLYIKTSFSKKASIGDSIAVNGVCLTVVDIKDHAVGFDLSEETLKVTNLGELTPGARVNIEPAMRADSSFGGHMVTGHVDCTGIIKTKQQKGDLVYFEISAPSEFMKYLVPKGSVAVDGISLTVVELGRDYFSLIIIPHTARITTLGFKGPGDRVNLEADIIGKYVIRYLEALPGISQKGVSFAD